MQPVTLSCNVFRVYLPPFFVSLHHWGHPSNPEHCPSLLHVQGYDPTGHYLSIPLVPFSTMIKNEIKLNVSQHYLALFFKLESP